MVASILQTTFSNAFSSMKIAVFWFKFHWNLFLMIQLTKFIIGLNKCLAANRWQVIIWTKDGSIYQHIHESVSHSELMYPCRIHFKQLVHEFIQWKWYNRQVNIGLGIGLGPNRQQAITLTNDDQSIWHYMVFYGVIRPEWVEWITWHKSCILLVFCLPVPLVEILDFYNIQP